MISPPISPCPLCASTDNVERPVALPEGGWQFVCRGDHDPYAFDVDSDAQLVPFPEDLAADLEILEDLRALILNEFQRVEYGIVEHMYGTAHRKKYDKLINAYDHGALEGGKYTTSSFIAGVLGRLRLAGQLNGAIGPATGYWSQNVAITYWCPAGVEPENGKTWEVFAIERDMDPMSWPLLGSTRAQRYWKGEFLQLAAGDPTGPYPQNDMEWDGRSESLLESVYKIAVNPQSASDTGER